MTFLFTDVEGSSGHWEAHRELAQAAIERHDVLLREAIERHGGYVFKTVGDAFCAAFSAAPDALAAAVDVQAVIAEEPWPPGCTIRVRIALHSGCAEERSSDYFGPPVNRVARLLACAHGGQTLVSNATWELVADNLPRGMDLRNLGEHRLKDLSRSEHIFQVVVPGAPSDFPPIKALDSHPNNLPPQATPFVGRQRVLESIVGCIRRPEPRLLTLTGPGGIGKTRLALQAAAQVVDEFEHGVFLAPLDSIGGADLVCSAIAHALRVSEMRGEPLEETIWRFLEQKHLLLVIDNFEHVMDAGPLLVGIMLRAPRVKVLVTSRSVLHLSWERSIEVPSLSIPGPHDHADVQALSQYESVALFVDRAQAVRSGFALTAENASSVSEICRRLDGLPLAIELAAVRTRLFSPAALLRRLSHRLKLLAHGPADMPARHQTLEATLIWSFELLPEAERVLFARLGVFAGGFTLEAVEAACNTAGDPDFDALEAVCSLFEQSLVRQEGEPDGEPRFHMLETIREFAVERLRDAGDEQNQRERHAAYFGRLAIQAEREMLGPAQEEWLRRLDAEHDNLHEAVDWTIQRGEARSALEFVNALWPYWRACSHFTEGRRATRAALDLAGSVRAELRAKTLRGAGMLAALQGDYEDAKKMHEESLALFHDASDEEGIAHAQKSLGQVALDLGEDERAEVLFQDSLQRFGRLGDERGAAEALNNLGLVGLYRGAYASACTLFEEYLARSRASRNARGVVTGLSNLGAALLELGNIPEAKARLEESLQLRHRLNDSEGAISVIEVLAVVAGAQGEAMRAARLLAACEALREEIESPLSPTERATFDGDVATVRGKLGENEFYEAWERGRSMTLEQTINDALTVPHMAVSTNV